MTGSAKQSILPHDEEWIASSLSLLAMTVTEIGWRARGASARLSAMKATARKVQSASDIAARVDAIDWTQTTADLDAQGGAVLKGLLTPSECAALAGLYPDDGHF